MHSMEADFVYAPDCPPLTWRPVDKFALCACCDSETHDIFVSSGRKSKLQCGPETENRAHRIDSLIFKSEGNLIVRKGNVAEEMVRDNEDQVRVWKVAFGSKEIPTPDGIPNVHW